jgi:hypothetical protein
MSLLIDILVHLPVRQEVKLERHVLEHKVKIFQVGLSLNTEVLDCKWQCSEAQMEAKVKLFEENVLQDG